MKIMFFNLRIQNHENHRIPRDNHEVHKSPRKKYENHDFFLEFQMRIIKTLKSLNSQRQL